MPDVRKRKKVLRPVDCNPIYSDGPGYDEMNTWKRDDIPFYIKLAKKAKGPILELACGTGRVTIPLAEEGFDITGLDISKDMLAQAKKKAQKEGYDINWVLGDVRYFDLNKRFALIIYPFNAIGHLHTREEVELCLRSVQKHLLPSGRFVIDIFSPSMAILAREGGKPRTVYKYKDPCKKCDVVVTETNRYDPAAQMNLVKWRYKYGNRTSVVRELNMRMFFPQELDALLYYNGLEIDAKFGDYDLRPFGPNSEKQILVSRLSEALRTSRCKKCGGALFHRKKSYLFKMQNLKKFYDAQACHDCGHVAFTPMALEKIAKQRNRRR